MPYDDTSIDSEQVKFKMVPIHVYKGGSPPWSCYTIIQAKVPDSWNWDHVSHVSATNNLHSNDCLIYFNQSMPKDLRMDGQTPTIGMASFFEYTPNRLDCLPAHIAKGKPGRKKKVSTHIL